MMLSKNSNVMYVILLILYVLGINGKLSFSFNLPRIGTFSKESSKVIKNYSGKRVQNDSIRMAYFSELTLAIVELGPSKLLLNCELIELYEHSDIFKALGPLQDVVRPIGITFEEMLVLMDQCKELDYIKNINKEDSFMRNKTNHISKSRGILENNPFSLLSGIIPGTKWCGTGDIAKDYFDLGSESSVDSCCRAHDLCPVKIKARSQNYNLTNNSLYTKSHCKCDSNLYKCLKRTGTQSANIMGNIYFNLIQVPCLEDTKFGRKFKAAKYNY